MFGFIKSLSNDKREKEDQSKILSFEQTQEVSKALGLVGKDLSHLIINTYKVTGLRGEDLVNALTSLQNQQGSRIEALKDDFLKGGVRSNSNSIDLVTYSEVIGGINPFTGERPPKESKGNASIINDKSFSFDYKKVEHIPREIVEQIREANPSISDDLISSMFKDCEFVKGAI